MYKINNDIEFKTSIIRSCLWNYSDAYIHFEGTITIPNTAAVDAAENHSNKKVIFKNCALFTDSLRKINNIHVDDANYIDVVVPMYSLIKFCDIYSKTS